MPTWKEYIPEFSIALEQEIDTIQSGKGKTIIPVTDGMLIKNEVGIYIYSFTLPELYPIMEDSEFKIEVQGYSYDAHIIQNVGQELIIGINANLGESVSEAQLIIDLSFLYEILKFKLNRLVENNETSRFSLSDNVFNGKSSIRKPIVDLPKLEKGNELYQPNDSQMKAIRKSIEGNLTLVWGPPGTGKTATLARIVECFLKKGLKVLVVSHSNSAVDEATEDIADTLNRTEFYRQGHIIRLGTIQKKDWDEKNNLVILEKAVEKIGEKFVKNKRQYESMVKELDSYIESLNSAEDSIKKITSLENKIQEFVDDGSEHKTLEYNKEVESLGKKIEKCLNKFGIEQNEISTKRDEYEKDRAGCEEEIKRMLKELAKIRREILSNVKVLCTTLTKTYTAREFPTFNFDVLILDEASMAPLPHLYWALTRCTRAAVIVGDFMQLPPICLSKGENENNGENKQMAQKWLGRSYYDLIGINSPTQVKDERIVLLRKQYRMHPKISEFPNKQVYNMLLRDAEIVRKKEELNLKKLDLSNSSLTAIDTSSVDPWCVHPEKSRFNLYNALLTTNIVKTILDNGFTVEDVGIISPYKLHAQLIGRILRDMGITREVLAATVHRFQGGQRRIIIFDTVEGKGANIAPMLTGEKGDDDIKLINVSVTRAKDKIIMIANMKHLWEKTDTIPSARMLRKLLQHFDMNGKCVDSKRFLKPLFVKDYEKWIKASIESAKAIEPNDIGVFDENTFYPVFNHDLVNAENEVIIASPFISQKRIRLLSDLLRVLIMKGRIVKLFTRPINKQSSLKKDAEEAIPMLRNMGVEILNSCYDSQAPGGASMHHKFAIIDKRIGWAGSLNIMSHNNAGELMMRFEYPKTVRSFLKICDVIAENCPICGKQKIVKYGPHGRFIGCSGFPKCHYKEK